MNAEKRISTTVGTEYLKVVSDIFKDKKATVLRIFATREEKIFMELVRMAKVMHKKLSYNPVSCNDEEKRLTRFYAITLPVHNKLKEVLEMNPRLNKARDRNFLIKLTEFYEITELGDKNPHAENASVFVKMKKEELEKILRSLKKR